MQWSSPSIGKQTIPRERLFSGAATGTGLTATYFDNFDFTGTSIARIDATLDFDWGNGSPDPAIGADTFSARWTGKLEAPGSEQYTLYTQADDGIRVWIDGALVIDNWSDHPPTDNSTTIALVAGHKYDLKVEYYENGGGAVARLWWSSPSIGKQPIPQSRLFP